VCSSSATTSAPGGALAGGAGDLLTAVRAVPDPRPGGARRHPTGCVLGVLVMSMASAGFESFVGAAQWAAGAGRALLLALGAVPDPLTGQVTAPSEATIRRIASTVDREALEAVVAAWTAAQLPPPPPGAGRTPVAVDGKTVRGARDGDRPAPHLLAACTHPSEQLPAVVLAQRAIPAKTNEIPMLTVLITDLRAAGHDPAGMLFTADALHTQRTTAALLHTAGAGYVLTVKGNQPGLRTAIRDRSTPRGRPAAAPDPAATGAPNNASSRSCPRPGSPSPAPPRPSASPATPAASTVNANARKSCTASPTSPPVKPTTPGSPSWSAGTGPSRTACTGSAT